MPTLRRRTPEKIERRKANKDFYQTARWHAFSRAYRKKYPLCAECLKKGVTEKAECVDHIIPLSEWIAQGGDPYDLINLQPLSNRCHSIKTSRENPGWNKQNKV